MIRPRLWRAAMVVLIALWFGLTGPLSPLDRWGFDGLLRLRSDHAPAVSNRIAHLDVGVEDLRNLSSTLQEYSGLGDIIRRLREQGAQVIVLDLLLMRGEEADFLPLWQEMFKEDDLVLGRTFDDSSRLPKGQRVSTGLVYLPSDSDGILRSYTWVQRDPSHSGPSLALAAYLKLRGLAWRPDMVGRDGQLEFPDITPDGQSVLRRLPAQVLLDERAEWRENSSANFYHLTPTMLKDWEQKPGPPRLAGKVVLVGYVAPGTGDLGTTPLNRSIPKVAVHSLALNGLIQNAWFQPMAGWRGGLLALALMLLSGRVSRLPRFERMLTWLMVSSGLLAGSATLTFYAHQTPWGISLLLCWTASLVLEVWLRDKISHSRLQALQVLADGEDPLLLKIVGNYQIIRKLGQGGFATVYQAVPAQTLDPAQSVALKIVHPASAESPEFRRRFLREIRISVQLRHPLIVKVFHSGEDVGLLYMAMELVEGRPLKHYLQGGHCWIAEQTLQILRPLLQGLAYAHGLKVVHRDLKPDNLMVLMESEVQPWRVRSLKIVDFGLAFDSQASQLTRTGEVFGTLDYLAPERIQGRADDPRSDLYAVGVIAYEMLTGSNPFQQQHPGEAILYRLSTDPPALLDLRPDLPAVLAAVVTRLMARDPDERFGSAQEVLIALSECREIE